MMKIYFAHPCFTEEQRDFKTRFLNLLKSALSKTPYRGEITIIDPFEHTPSIEGNSALKTEMAEYIKTECIRLLEESYLVIALVDYNDTGVAFEAGYAHAVNKPVILISTGECQANAMLLGSAKGIISNILDDEQIKRLTSLILFFYGTYKTSRKRPEFN
ncbi:MAG TPA: nucleoside 2-deoxyribosyltransferase [Syntrophorhabdaceae bacterium]|nr:nucleoside 2-deoxyribosyltransferase [Syntrophorhabdaceae bacterium]